MWKLKENNVLGKRRENNRECAGEKKGKLSFWKLKTSSQETLSGQCGLNTSGVYISYWVPQTLYSDYHFALYACLPKVQHNPSTGSLNPFLILIFWNVDYVWSYRSFSSFTVWYDGIRDGHVFPHVGGAVSEEFLWPLNDDANTMWHNKKGKKKIYQFQNVIENLTNDLWKMQTMHDFTRTQKTNYFENFRLCWVKNLAPHWDKPNWTTINAHAHLHTNTWADLEGQVRCMPTSCRHLPMWLNNLQPNLHNNMPQRVGSSNT